MEYSSPIIISIIHSFFLSLSSRSQSPPLTPHLFVSSTPQKKHKEIYHPTHQFSSPSSSLLISIIIYAINHASTIPLTTHSSTRNKERKTLQLLFVLIHNQPPPPPPLIPSLCHCPFLSSFLKTSGYHHATTSFPPLYHSLHPTPIYSIILHQGCANTCSISSLCSTFRSSIFRMRSMLSSLMVYGTLRSRSIISSML